MPGIPKEQINELIAGHPLSPRMRKVLTALHVHTTYFDHPAEDFDIAATGRVRAVADKISREEAIAITSTIDQTMAREERKSLLLGAGVGLIFGIAINAIVGPEVAKRATEFAGAHLSNPAAQAPETAKQFFTIIGNATAFSADAVAGLIIGFAASGVREKIETRKPKSSQQPALKVKK